MLKLIRLTIVVLAALLISSSFAQDRTLIIAVPGDIQNLDPTLSSGDTLTQEVLTSTYSFLVDFKRVQDADGQWIGDADSFVGNVAESFEVSKDGEKVTFHLRPGIKFSNGDPIDAAAVKFTYDRIFGQNGVTAFLTQMAAVDDADAVKVIDNETVEFNLSAANTLLLGNMAQFGHAILNPNVVKPHMTQEDPWAHEWLQNNTAGTESGPYVIERWDRGNQVVLARNPNFWGEVANDKVILQIIPDPSSRLAQLRAGAVDLALDIPTKDVAGLQSDPSVKVANFTTRSVGYLGMNNETPPFDNVKVRQAIAYAAPYDTILNNVLNGYGIQLTSPIPEGTPYHTDKFFTYKTDPERAKELLTEAGYPNGFDTTFTIPNDVAEAKEAAVWIQSALAQVGVNVQIEEMPSAAFTEKLQKREHTFFWANQWISINNDPFYHLFWLFKSDCCDYTRYKNDQVWKLIDEYTLSTDDTAREKAAMEIQKTILTESPWVFLFQPNYTLAMGAAVEGYTWYSADTYLRYQYLSRSDWN